MKLKDLIKVIGKSFETILLKLKMKYIRWRCANYRITNEEKEYILNDILAVKEALEIIQTEVKK